MHRSRCLKPHKRSPPIRSYYIYTLWSNMNWFKRFQAVEFSFFRVWFLPMFLYNLQENNQVKMDEDRCGNIWEGINTGKVIQVGQSELWTLRGPHLELLEWVTYGNSFNKLSINYNIKCNWIWGRLIASYGNEECPRAPATQTLRCSAQALHERFERIKPMSKI
jgi:hypothetical protein